MRKLLMVALWMSLSLACRAGVMATLPDGREIKLYDNMYALVIGNSDYSGGWSKLPNALTDAREVSARLTGMGFQVTEAFNLNSAAMNKESATLCISRAVKKTPRCWSIMRAMETRNRPRTEKSWVTSSRSILPRGIKTPSSFPNAASP